MLEEKILFISPFFSRFSFFSATTLWLNALNRTYFRIHLFSWMNCYGDYLWTLGSGAFCKTNSKKIHFEDVLKKKKKINLVDRCNLRKTRPMTKRLPPLSIYSKSRFCFFYCSKCNFRSFNVELVILKWNDKSLPVELVTRSELKFLFFSSELVT